MNTTCKQQRSGVDIKVHTHTHTQSIIWVR